MPERPRFGSLQDLTAENQSAVWRYEIGKMKMHWGLCECRSEGYPELYGTHKQQESTRYHNYPSPSDASPSDGDESSKPCWEQ